MKTRIRVGILFGGQSAEHEVSIQSAKNVYDALDKSKYEPILIGISKKGEWQSFPEQEFLKLQTPITSDCPTKNNVILNSVQDLIGIPKQVRNDKNRRSLDVAFPLLHGPMGEDGTVQGLLKLIGLPFVGADVLGSAVGMDKDVMKRLLRDAGLPIVRFLVFSKKEQKTLSFEHIKKGLGVPFFVKPANLGSSIGVAKVHSVSEFAEAIDKAFSYGRKILIEEGIDAREIECSVLGNEEKIASIPGEIVPNHEFYDYDAKYIDEDGAILEIPAKLNKKQVKDIQKLAIEACEVLCVDGMARVDFFIDKKSGKLFVNEINTIPGFTSISMYPKLWEASGISYSDLISRLIGLAIVKDKKE